MTVCAMPVAVELLSLRTSTDRLLVDLVHVVQERQVLVRVRMPCIVLDALLEVFHSLTVHLNLEVRQPQVVLQLSVLRIEGLSLVERQDR